MPIPARQASYRFLAFVSLVGLLLRLIPIALFPDLGADFDMAQYDMLARSLAAGNGYRWYARADAEGLARLLKAYNITATLPEDPRGILTSYRAPAYPFLLSGVYRLVPSEARFLAARLMQALLGAALPALCFALGAVLGLGRRGRRFAAWAVALYPMLAFYPLGLMTENLFIPLLVAALVLLILSARQGRLPLVLLAGALAGALTLTRALATLFWPLFVFWLWKKYPHRRRALLAAAVYLVALLAFTVPWSVRNSRLLNLPMWLESSLGYVLYLGYHPTSTGVVRPETTLDLLPIHDDMARHQAGMQAVRGFIAEDPLRALRQILWRVPTFWGLEWREFNALYTGNMLGEWSPWLLAASLVVLALPLMFLVALALVGLLARPLSAAGWLLLGVMAITLGLHALTMAEPRYHLPLIPLLAVFAATAVEGGLPRPLPRRILLGWLIFALFWTAELLAYAPKLTLMLGPGGNLLNWGY